MIGIRQLRDQWGWDPEDALCLLDRMTEGDALLLYVNVTLDSSKCGMSHLIMCGPTRTISSVENAPKTFDPQGAGAPSTTEVLIGQVDVDALREYFNE